MNPLEAAAKALHALDAPGSTWPINDEVQGAFGAAIRRKYLTCARAAKNALADNVDEKMVDAFDSRFSGLNIEESIAAAIRAAGEG